MSKRTEAHKADNTQTAVTKSAFDIKLPNLQTAKFTIYASITVE